MKQTRRPKHLRGTRPPQLSTLAREMIRNVQAPLPHELTGEKVLRPGEVGQASLVDSISERIAPADLDIINSIVDRMWDLAAAHKMPDAIKSRLMLAMDLANVHVHNRPLNLHRLLMSSDDDLSHDVLGIGLHIDRANGQLKNGWAPRHWQGDAS